MKHTKLTSSCAALLACAFAAGPVTAYDEMSDDISEGDSGGFVGLGVSTSPDYEGGDDYEARVAPFGRYNWGSGRYVSLGGTSGTERAGRLRANLISTEMSNIWEFGPILQYRFERDGVDNDKVDDMDKVDAAVEAGAYVGMNTGPWSAGIGFAADVSSEHEGYLVYTKGSYDIQVNKRFVIDLGVHLTWADEDFMDEYFGVTGRESIKTGLSKYQADSDFKDVGFSVTGHYMFNQTWGILGNVNYTRMLGDAEDSPLVDDVGEENQFSGVVAVTYAF